MNKKNDPRIDVARHNLRMAVAHRKTNFSEAAESAGLSRNALSQFVSGRTSMSYANMLRICDVLDIPIGALHRPDAVTDTKLRLYRLIERLPDHQMAKAIRIATDRPDDAP